ncbi:MAG: vanadium-dependent haloperoxidase [Paucibacter sp.]|nr:vanadium-dependent haloperoxidase [Roseateles sp.]
MKTSFAAAVTCLGLLGALGSPSRAGADVITDWNDKACAIVAKLGPGAGGHRAMAVVQVSVYDAVSAIGTDGGKYKPYIAKLAAPAGASVAAAVAAANHVTLAELVPSEKSSIDSTYQAAIDHIPDGQPKVDGIAIGEKAAAAVLARAAADGSNAPDTYRPRTTPGTYVPTLTPVFTQWPGRTPWVMTRADQFRPAPPPSISSEIWLRDYNEVKSLGAKNSTTRTAEQTAIARFWEETRPLLYHPVLRPVATQPGRSIAQNAHLYAAAAMAIDDALIAVFDAKYAYLFWRPITAIRNGGGNASLTQDVGWTPLIATPMHPEYPCAHCVSSGAIAAVIEAELGSASLPILSSSSPTADGAVRQWRSLNEFMEEVQAARIYDGVHYRNSAQVGTALGQSVGKLVVQKF